MLSEDAITRLVSVELVDLTSETGLYTVPAGYSCVVTHVILREASASLATSSISFGFTSAAYTDVIANATHTELTDNTLYTVLIAKVGATLGLAGTIFTLKSNTTQAATITVDVFGYLF